MRKPLSRAKVSQPNEARRQAALQRKLAAAFACLQGGAIARAETLANSAVGLAPDDPEALHLGGVIALRAGRVQVAVERLSRARLSRPADPSVLNDFGLALYRAGRFAEAAAVLVEATRLKPDFPAALVNLGGVMGDLGREDDALACYRRAIELQPDLAEAHENLARQALRLGLRLEAVAAAQQALELRPGMPGALRTLGQAFNALGRFESAVAVWTAARAAGMDFRADLAETQTYFGQFPEAEANFRLALQDAPSRAEWHRALATIVRHHPGHPDIAVMRRLYRSSRTSDDGRMHLAFGLGKALEDAGAHEEAFDFFVEGNRLRRRTFAYDPAESAADDAALARTFTPAVLERRNRAATDGPAPIFVLGMPRSGTTLVEQVLATHPQIATVGEIPLLNRVAGALKSAAAEDHGAGDISARFEPARLAQLAGAYLGYLRRLEPDARYIIDKTPGNFMLIGIIRLLFPNARVIHCRRDPVDNGLSIFKTWFASDGLRYAWDLAEIGRYYGAYRGLMAHWQAVLPGFVHDASYEALVGDFEPESTRLFAAIGLARPPEADEFFQVRRAVQTASAAQVRQPLFSTSIGQRGRYGERAAPLLEALAAAGVPVEGGAARRDRP